MTFKSGFVAIIGRPNVGKSTLMNNILQQKISIISDKVQTTRRRLRGILTEPRGQIIFVDTPGVHKPVNKLGEFLASETRLAVPDSDLILFMVDGSTIPGGGDKWVVENIVTSNKPIVMCINKIDLIKDYKLRSNNVESYKNLFDNKKILTCLISAKTGRNTDDLLSILFRMLPKGPIYYPEDSVTDQSLRAIAEEIIREKIIINTQEELPHCVAILIDNYSSSETLTSISASIYVERDSQKGMIIGKNGLMLKNIGTMARKEIEDLTESKVFLGLNVKVKKNWRKNPSALRQFGYETK